MYLALDFPDYNKTKNFIERNDLQGVPVKVGMELFYKEGSKIINYLKEQNHSIFLDLKLFDIPTTVERAMHNLADFEVDFVNVHALGGSEMIKRAKSALQSKSSSNHETKLLAVTILTSMDNQIIKDDLGLSLTVNQEVLRLAKLSESSGADGVVCSVRHSYQHHHVAYVRPGRDARCLRDRVRARGRRQRGVRAVVRLDLSDHRGAVVPAYERTR